MAAYKKGSMSNANRKALSGGISIDPNKTYPSQGTSITVTNPNQTTPPSESYKIPSPKAASGILESYSKMFGGNNATANQSWASGGPSSMADLESASMRLADAASRRSMMEAAIGSELRMGEMGYGSELRRGEMGYGSELRRGEMGYGSELRRGEMGYGSALKRGEMGYGSKLSMGEMEKEYGLRGSLMETEADIAARQAGYSGLGEQQADAALERLRRKSKGVGGGWSW